ncbi:MAG: response regulator [Alphaproteobacteria bacterium]|nr:response regulator [Alphaproteobacteria bacterium]
MTAARLLIVDDDRDFAEGLAEALELFDLPSVIAFTGEEAVEAFRTCDFNVVLMDIGLPGLNGVESLLKIKEINPKVGCFLLTGYSSDHLTEQGIEAGAIDILTKPVNLDEILRRIRQIESGN